jgi:hypothetical protein
MDYDGQADRRRPTIPDWTGGQGTDRAPGWPRRPGRHGLGADRPGGGRAAAAAAGGPGRGTRQAAMLVEHHHQPDVFDAGHCRACAHQAGLPDHYRQVQQEEATLREARWRANVALWSAGAALLLAVVALLTG